jgi:hypothetical protein
MSEQSYGFDESTGASLGGIHEDVTLKSIDFEAVKEGSEKALRFKFGKEGMSFIHTEFKISEEGVKKFAAMVKKPFDEALKLEYQKQGERIKHILVAMLRDRKLKLRGSDWKSFCQGIIELAGDSYKGELFRMKVVYNTKGFATFPNRAISPFIQNMKDINALTINPKYDRVIPPQPQDTTEDADDSSMYPETAEPKGAEDGLQF